MTGRTVRTPEMEVSRLEAYKAALDYDGDKRKERSHSPIGRRRMPV